MPRGVVSGRFSLGGVEQTAIVGGDARPRLALLSADGTTATEVMAPSTTFTVFVGQVGTTFSPSQLNIQAGDTVHWVWSTAGHNVTSGSNCTNDNLFCSPLNTNCGANPTSSAGAAYDRTFLSVGTFPYFCRPHCLFGMTGTVIVGPPPGGILEATNLQLAKSGTDTQFTYTPACGATAHAIYYGTGSLAPLGPQWRDSICTDTSGSTTVALSNPTGLQYFVVVGQTASAEGSYGKQTGNMERAEATEVGLCDVPQSIGTTCP
jgi:plastocyanin